MKVALYARVSTDDRGQNPETQLFRLREIAKARGYEVEQEYIDYKSGKDDNRPGLKALLSDAKHHEFDIVLVTRLDRMMRSTKNLFNVLEHLESYHVLFECTEQDIHTRGAMGRFMLTMLSAVAEFEREIGAGNGPDALCSLEEFRDFWNALNIWLEVVGPKRYWHITNAGYVKNSKNHLSLSESGIEKQARLTEELNGRLVIILSANAIKFDGGC